MYFSTDIRGIMDRNKILRCAFYSQIDIVYKEGNSEEG
jgi:hypothetical protein